MFGMEYEKEAMLLFAYQELLLSCISIFGYKKRKTNLGEKF